MKKFGRSWFWGGEGLGMKTIAPSKSLENYDMIDPKKQSKGLLHRHTHRQSVDASNGSQIKLSNKLFFNRQKR